MRGGGSHNKRLDGRYGIGGGYLFDGNRFDHWRWRFVDNRCLRLVRNRFKFDNGDLGFVANRDLRFVKVPFVERTVGMSRGHVVGTTTLTLRATLAFFFFLILCQRFRGTAVSVLHLSVSLSTVGEYARPSQA